LHGLVPEQSLNHIPDCRVEAAARRRELRLLRTRAHEPGTAEDQERQHGGGDGESLDAAIRNMI